MSTQTDAIASKLGQVQTLLTDISTNSQQISSYVAPESSGSSYPVGVDCLAGTIPATLSYPAGDAASDFTWNTEANWLMGYYDRLSVNAPDGSIPFIGHSIIQGMPVNAASPFGINMGIGSESMRHCLNRLNRNGTQDLIRRAGAVVLMTGLCDLGNTTYYGPWTNGNASGTITEAMLYPKLRNWISGKWVICKILPVTESISPGCNAQIAIVNAAIDTRFGGLPNVAIVNPPTQFGNDLPSQYTIDGTHPNKAGYALITPLIASALHSLGVQ